jgi:hypothetical protein
MNSLWSFSNDLNRNFFAIFETRDASHGEPYVLRLNAGHDPGAGFLTDRRRFG